MLLEQITSDISRRHEQIVASRMGEGALCGVEAVVLLACDTCLLLFPWCHSAVDALGFILSGFQIWVCQASGKHLHAAAEAPSPLQDADNLKPDVLAHTLDKGPKATYQETDETNLQARRHAKSELMAHSQCLSVLGLLRTWVGIPQPCCDYASRILHVLSMIPKSKPVSAEVIFGRESYDIYMICEPILIVNAGISAR